MSKKLDEAQYLLDSVQILNARVERWSNEMDRCRTLIERVNCADPDFPVVQTTLQPSSGAEWDAYLKAKAAYEGAVDKYVAVKTRVLQTMDRMDNVKYTKILELRYLSPKSLSWEQIGERVRYTPSGAWRLHDRALEDFAEKLKVSKDST